MKTVLVAICCFSFSIVFSQNYNGGKATKKPDREKGAGCIPPSKSIYLEINNVKAIIHTGGNMWQIPTQNFSQYEVPKNSGIMALFTSALWLGGVDVNGQLKLAALRYRDGNDYWTGPLSNESAEIDAFDCLKYDQHFVSSQDRVREFDAWFTAGLQDDENGTSLQAAQFPGYEIPDFIKAWPAHGDVSKGQDYYLAPFYDRDEDGNYSWENGDYPWYDFKSDKVCRVDRRVSLYGDHNFWWVMNDKGNIHTETGGDPIGMEIRAQAFGFATNDEINNMTFYNYELINRGTQTLFGTYFGMFVDGALGDPYDDFVGCDVNRGLAYLYNGDNFDGDNLGFKGYGSSPPAIGVDFFEGPFQDNDDIDNAYGIGTDEALNGIGYGDGIVDNERFGMRRFLYYINTGGGANQAQTDPSSAFDYYNFLRGRWKDGSPFYYGGNGHLSDPDANTSVPADFMFPGDTDPLGWGTGGVPQPEWTEVTANNFPFDRRFLQSAGPFTLRPGAVNNITTGVVWARAGGGDAFSAVQVVRRADDKAQALFENCFRVLDGPHAPDLQIQELNNELILTISNPSNSNNKGEAYTEFDPFIVAADTTADKFYRFQGYQIFQLSGPDVSVSDIGDIGKARIVAQCDIEDDVTRIVNFEYDDDLEASMPVEKVKGENKGIRHSFRFTEDVFASGNRTLVNFKSYYYVAVSYAHNNYLNYDPSDPSSVEGQKKRYIASRKAPLGEVRVVSGMPHNPAPEAMGTAHFAEYGFQPEITRLDGRGNGMFFTDLTTETENALIESGRSGRLTYKAGSGPIGIKVIDPLNVAKGYFECRFQPHSTGEIDSSVWTIYRYIAEGEQPIDSVQAEKSISFNNEQLIPQWGISVTITQHSYYDVGISAPEHRLFAEPISATITFSDPLKNWLGFIEDQDAYSPLNWIRSGAENPDLPTVFDDPSLVECYPDKLNTDPEEKYENWLGGGVTHGSLVGTTCAYMPVTEPANLNFFTSSQMQGSLARASGVDIVITDDKTKWTRCAVIELCPVSQLAIGNAGAGTLRKSLSVNKNGVPDGSGTMGMGWFPGYAIDIESGYRLHMAFGENSFLQTANGSDMIWNPVNELFADNGTIVLGGMHPVYVFGVGINNTACPFYDGVNNWVYDQYATETSQSYRNLYTNLMWVAYPRLAGGHSLLESDVRIRLRLNTEYMNFTATGSNSGRPHYGWSMDKYGTDKENTEAQVSVLDLINIVPNPYYAYSEYERSKIDTRVRITNLPEKCTVSIHATSGKLVRQYKKDNAITYVDWNLTNSINIPVSSGVYIVHIDVPGVGETVRKAFIGMKVPDFTGF